MALAGYAETLRLQGKFEEAAIKFQEALIIKPKDAFALNGYGDSLLRQGKFAEALLQFQEALTIKPDSAFALRGEEKARRQLGYYK